MIRCEYCGEVMDEEELVRRFYRDPDTCFEGVKCVCPHCHWDEFKEVEQCEECGEYFAPNELECGLCVECEKEVQRLRDAFLNGLTDAQKRYLEEADL